MLTLVITGIVGLIIIIALIIIIQNRPDFWFWLFLNLYFDPGGYVIGYLGGNVVGRLTIEDICFPGILICMLFAKINWKLIFGDKFLVSFLTVLFIFFAYYYIVYGGVAPYLHNDLDYSTFLIKSRRFAYGFIILISVYAFTLRGLSYFYTITIFLGVVVLSLYLVSLFTGVELIPIWRFLRKGTDMMRITLYSYGLFGLVFPVAIIVAILSRKFNIILKFKPLLYCAGTLLIVSMLITLTRRTQLDIIGMIILVVLIISYLLQISKLSVLLKIAIPVLVVIVALSITFPKYVGYVTKTAEDTFLLVITGQDSRGVSDYRVTGSNELEITKEYIRNNLLLGTGYTYWNYNEGYASSTRGATYARAADAAGEVSIYYLFFGFGIVGAILILALYFMMGQLFFKLIKLLRSTWTNYLNDPLTIIFSIYILLIIASKFTIKLYQFSSDFRGAKMNETAVLLGVGFALYRKIYLNIYRA